MIVHRSIWFPQNSYFVLFIENQQCLLFRKKTKTKIMAFKKSTSTFKIIVFHKEKENNLFI